MFIRTGDAVWEGTLREGTGSLHHGHCDEPYSFQSRFAEGEGTNPEELIAAAHAGCFSMFLSGVLEEAGYRPERIHTRANVRLEHTKGGYSITSIELDTEAHVPGVGETAFLASAEEAKAGCPVSRALAVPSITLKARLIS